ncbi:hypothetical protein C8J56DRAFT_926496 [Mycena floridula]|nr:hypothetical protein C8J56DRAFT_926496 [Mycena floridula]
MRSGKSAMGIKDGLKDRRSRLSFSRLYRRTVVVNTFRLAWIVVIIWGELGLFYWSLSGCRWPDATLLASGSTKPTHVMLIADAQVRHPSAFRMETSWIGFLRQFVFDLNLKKSWHVTARLRPHFIIFLGDMTAHGKHTTTAAEFQKYWAKFKSIFHVDPAIPVYFIPGNNDVGMGVSSHSSGVRSFYEESFGQFNQRLSIRNHTFVCLDAPGLVDEDYQRSGHGVAFERWTPTPGGGVEFIKSVSSATPPLILLTHIPLSRPDSASCGPLREKGSIRRGVGHGYQNTLGKQTTAFLLDALRPAAIFSADNRDYCEYQHSMTLDGQHGVFTTKEITVKSFSMANSIRHPGFQLLSLIDPAQPSDLKSQTFAGVPCLLPDQYGIYQNIYWPFAFLTLVMLSFFNFHRVRRLGGAGISSLPLRSNSSSNHSSPPDSATWSPYTPKAPVSPLNSFPESIRTPNPLSGPTLRAASRPTTPLPSPMLSPMIYSHDDDEEDSMYPTQYATRNQRLTDDSWPAEYGPDIRLLGSAEPPESSTHRVAKYQNRPWSLSWTFVLGGQRRRMTIRAPTPSWAAFRDLLGLLEGPDVDASLQRRGVVKSTFLDGVSVGWPVIAVWSLITWWLF